VIDIHAASWAGSADKPNEDAYAALADFVIVADGATAPASLGTGCIHGPRWYARQLVSRVTVAYSAGPETGLPEILSEAIRTTAAAHAHSCDPGHPGTPSATVVMLHNRATAIDWLVLGDATLVLETVAGLQVRCDDRLFNSSTAERNAVLTTDARDDQRAEKVATLVDAQRRFRNVEGGFWIAAANPDAAFHALTGSEDIPPESSWRAALLTDGAAAAADTYRLTNWPGLLDLLATAGPTAVLRSIRKIEADDPHTSSYPRIKQSDDATVAYLSGGGGA
jgi:hypothetical protein